MNEAALSGWIMSSSALLIMGLCVPLIFRKISMNEYYGFRTREAFESDAKWFEVNEKGGKALFWFTSPMLVSGVLQIMLKPGLDSLFYFLVPIMFPVIGAITFLVLRSRRRFSKIS